MHLLCRFPQLYNLVRPLVFKLDPEAAHVRAIKIAKTLSWLNVGGAIDPILYTKVAGMSFSNPIGLAAGFDKHAEAMEGLLGLGFGFVEVGSITPKPQQGNEKPRLFRLEEDEAVINRFGFNSDGFEICLKRLALFRQSKSRYSAGIVGINIGKNKESVDALADYVAGVAQFKAYANYITINISSPNTPGLRDLQGAPLADLLSAVMRARGSENPVPLFLKIAPDLSQEQLEEISRIALASGVDGMIISNTTVTRPSALQSRYAHENGGLSGRPLFELSTRVLKTVYQMTQGQLPLIGVGGVSTAQDAYAKIRAGASLVQIYSALVYQGPFVIPKINDELAALLRRDGFSSLSAAVGCDAFLM